MYRSSPKKHRSNIVLACNVNGNHIQQIRWFKNDIELLPFANRIEFDSHKLILKHPSRETDGNYRCTARNRIGTIRSDLYRLEIANDVEGAENANTIQRHIGFKCAHHPHRKLTGEPIDHANKIASTLLCRGKRSGDIVRQPADEMLPIALRQTARQLQRVYENHRAILDCDLKNVDKDRDNVLVKWKRDGKLIRQVELNGASSDVANTNIMENPLLRSDERILLNNRNGSLIIASTLPNDAGIYECSVYKNVDSLVGQQSIELAVIEELRFSPKPTSKQMEMGNAGKLHCKVQGTPAPQVRWIKVISIYRHTRCRMKMSKLSNVFPFLFRRTTTIDCLIWSMTSTERYSSAMFPRVIEAITRASPIVHKAQLRQPLSSQRWSRQNSSSNRRDRSR